MAKTTIERGFFDRKVSMELKKDLQRVVDAIMEEDNCSLEATDRAMQTLFALKDLKMLNKSDEDEEDSLCRGPLPPQEFRCPISGKLIEDPVVIASGQTYDRISIQKWLNDGYLTCPQTKQVLSHTNFTPNNLLREMIQRWCKENHIPFCNPVQQTKDVVTCTDREHLISLLNKLSSSSFATTQEVAAKEIRAMSKHSPSFRALFGEMPGTISQLLMPFSREIDSVPPDVHENLIATILNLSIHDKNKKLIAENPEAIPLLIKSLSIGNIDTRSNAAAALFSLSSIDSNKHLIGKLGALKPLIDLLEGGNVSSMEDAASAIFSLCIVLENKCKAVAEGAVPVIMKKIQDHILVDELVAILAFLSTHHIAIDEMEELGAVPFLLNVIKESNNERTKENCISILYTMCYSDRARLRMIRREEDANKTISKLAENGTSRAQRKANGLLDRLRKYAYNANTA